MMWHRQVAMTSHGAAIGMRSNRRPVGPAIFWLTVTAVLGAVALLMSDPPRVRYGKPVKLGVISDKRVRESSGLAISRSFPGCYWTHNDSGDSARIFLLDGKANTKAVFTIADDDPLDWEAMAAVQLDRTNYLLVGDIGNNSLRREELTVTVVKEPNDRSADVLPLQAKITFRFEDKPHDCEAMAVDPVTHEVILATKSLNGDCHVYAFPLKIESNTVPLTATKIATLDIPFVTGMDISPDGRRAIIVTYVGAYEFVRRRYETWKSAFARPPRILEVPQRRQGEAICFAADGRSLVLTSEGRDQPMWLIPAE